jgi:hypothetical protein
MKDTLISMAIKYNIASKFTSFIAVEERNESDQVTEECTAPSIKDIMSNIMDEEQTGDRTIFQLAWDMDPIARALVEKLEAERAKLIEEEELKMKEGI